MKNKEYEIIKKYYLENQFNKKWFEKEFFKIDMKKYGFENIPDNQYLVFSDGFLFLVAFNDKREEFTISDRFYELNEKQNDFVRLKTIEDIQMTIDYIETTALELAEAI